MKLQDNYDVGIYCRLSRDDHNGTLESMSIANQRQVLIDYVKEKGWRLKECYIDDGFTGTNFERPDFKRMIRDAQAGRIDCIITKDLSRLGRNYAMTGFIHKNYGDKITIAQIAASGNVCRSKCFELFDRYMIKTPNAYLTDYRIQKSRELLNGTACTISEIALACGFQSASYFTQVFRQTLGLSPKAYRENQIKGQVIK